MLIGAFSGLQEARPTSQPLPGQDINTVSFLWPATACHYVANSTSSDSSYFIDGAMPWNVIYSCKGVFTHYVTSRKKERGLGMMLDGKRVPRTRAVLSRLLSGVKGA